MKTTLEINGKKRIVLHPENELETVFLKEFAKSKNIEVIPIDESTAVMGKVVDTGLIIQTETDE